MKSRIDGFGLNDEAGPSVPLPEIDPRIGA